MDLHLSDNFVLININCKPKYACHIYRIKRYFSDRVLRGKEINCKQILLSPFTSLPSILFNIVCIIETLSIILISGYIMTPVPSAGSPAGNADTTFTIDDNGVITLRKQLNYNVRHSYSYTLQVYDNGSPPLVSLRNATVHFEIVFFSEARPSFLMNPYVSTVNESAPLATSIVQVRANTSEVNGGPLTYKIVTPNARSTFSIEPNTGIIRNIVSLDYESTRSYSFLVEVTDAGNFRTTTTLVVVDVTDVNDNRPVFVLGTQSSYNISESAGIGAVVTKLAAKDADSEENKRHSFSFLEGDTTGVFMVSHNGYITVIGKLDYRVKNQYKLVVEVKDHGTPSLMSSITLTIDVSKAADLTNRPQFAKHHHTISCVDEGTTNLNLLTVKAINSNPIATTTLTYSLSGNSDDRVPFRLNDQTGVVSLVTPLDYETKKHHNFLVTASNNEGLQDVATISVCVNDVDDNRPVFAHSMINVNVSENENVGLVVAKLTVVDADTTNFNANRVYKIVQGNFPVTFAIDNNGIITLVKRVDSETLQSKVIVFLFVPKMNSYNYFNKRPKPKRYIKHQISANFDYLGNNESIIYVYAFLLV